MSVLFGILVCALTGIAVWAGSFQLRLILLLYVAVSPLIPTAFGIPVGGPNGIVISPTRLVAVLCLLSMAVAAFRGNGLRRRFPLSGVFAVYIAVRALGLAFAPDSFGALTFVVGEAGLITVALCYLAYSVIRTPRQSETLVTVLLASGVAASLAGLWEATTQLNFTANVLMPLVGMVSDVPLAISTKAGVLPRLNGTLDHPLALGGFMVLLLPMAIQRVVMCRGLRRAVQWAVLACIGFSLFGSFSRIAQFAAILQTLTLLMVYRQRLAVWAIGIGVAAAAVWLLPLYAGINEGGGVASSLLLPTRTFGIIAQRWLDLGAAFMAEPRALLIGFGYGRSVASASASGGAMALLYSRMDTDVLRILALTGVIGFASWIALFHVFFATVAGNRRRRRQLRKSPVLGIVVGVAGTLVTAIPGTSVLTYTQTWPVIGVCIGAALGVARLRTRRPSSQPTPLMPPAHLLEADRATD
jgi:hypothetical protein